MKDFCFQIRSQRLCRDSETPNFCFKIPVFSFFDARAGKAAPSGFPPGFILALVFSTCTLFSFTASAAGYPLCPNGAATDSDGDNFGYEDTDGDGDFESCYVNIQPIAPMGQISSATPEFNWHAVSNATNYMLYIYDRTSRKRLLRKKFSASSICNNSTCQLRPGGISLDAGSNYIWRARIRANGSWASWSKSFKFSLGGGAPAASSTIAPKDTIASTTPAYSWRDVGNTEVYQLWVYNRTTRNRIHYRRYNPSDVCSGGTCSVVPAGLELTRENPHQWRVRGRNSSGWGDWSARSAFSVAAGGPDDNCDYSQAHLNNGWGWNPVTRMSCPPLDSETCAVTALSNASNPQSGSVDIDNGNRFNITRGTGNTDNTNNLISNFAGGNRGLRTYCMVSHYSYEDAVVNPPSGMKHLHMFWGNTRTDSIAAILGKGGSSTCEGGVCNRSAYWMPALFDGSGKVVLPLQVVTYYKSFGAYRNGAEVRLPGNSVQRIPNGLRILANRNVKNFGNGQLKINDCDYQDTDCRARASGRGVLTLKIAMPQCVAVDGANNPVQSSPAPFNSHMAYATGDANQSGHLANFCPEPHPYRIPQVEVVAMYKNSGLGDWKLASDIMNGTSSGATLHGDYVASWHENDGESESAMDFLVRCNQNEANCEHGNTHAQLPERFVSSWGPVIYNNGAQLIGEIIRPFTSRQPSATR